MTADEKAINVFVHGLLGVGGGDLSVIYVRLYMQTPLNARESQISNTL